MKEITVGLIPAPELPETIAYKLEDSLPDDFAEMIDGELEWKVEIVRDPLTGAAGKVDEIIKQAAQLKKSHNWTYAVCLTDLPIFSKKNVVLGDVNDREGVAQISVPAFGVFPMRRRVKNAIVQLVSELYYRVNGHGQSLNDDISARNNKNLLRTQFPLSPIRKITPPNTIEEVDVRFILLPRTHGRLRVISGMAYANRPWTIIPAFKSVVGIAFATGTYGLIFTSMWNMSAAYGAFRFVLLMFCAILCMIVWIMFAHNLWERPTKKSRRKLRMLYNSATIITLSVAVIVYYVMLYALFLIAVAFFVPPDLYASAVGLKPDEVSIKHFLQLTWLVTSIATLAGAIGSGLESEDTVRKIMYGYRQHQRYLEMEKNNKEVEDD
ncbi:5,10-methylene-tetrahydrofolate dehydrogenase [Virgibacillus kekensis]|uniref:5,10-methylene-tetrahydrofolate dehydrogenase n=1 Tax=Virgibacillus kekensis TaxID=202261 RepID=A0ABV9DHE9_9BACI